MLVNPLAVDLDHVLNHTRELWNELRGTHVFITGGTGFFGCWLLESFLWANDRLNLDARITILTRSPASFRAKAPHLAGHETVSVMEGDVRTFDFPKGEFTHIIHAATEASSKLNAENPLLMLDTIVEGTRRTLNFAEACKAKKFLLTSSGAVYGRQPSDITHVPEEYMGAPDALTPTSSYGEGKRIAEHLCALYANSSLETKIARCFAFVGPHLPLDVHFAIGNFIRDGMHGGPIIIRGDGTPHRSYLYAADLVIWLWTILLRGQSCRAYNVGGEESLSIMEVAERVSNGFRPKVQIERRGIPKLRKPVERYVPSIDRAKSELELYPLVDLQTSIHKTIAWADSQH
jgi:nucleoside-diphosphate-sugar epimerase